MDPNGRKIFSATKLGNLMLKNRIIRAGCFEGMYRDQKPDERLTAHHCEVAAGGTGMTTIAYAAVSRNGMVSGHEMRMRRELIPDLKKTTHAIHQQGAAVSVQLGHAGFFTHSAVIGETPLGPSPKRCLFRNSTCRPMNETDMQQVRNDFADACLIAKEAGMDAVEIHAGHGYLLNQFLSPWTNKRKDAYGGSIDNRLRFPVSVIAEIRKRLGADFPILIKMNLMDGFMGGLRETDALKTAKAFQDAGASALIGSCGFVARNPFFIMRGEIPIDDFVRNAPNRFTKWGMRLYYHLYMKRNSHFKELYLFDYGQRLLKEIDIPLVLLGGVCSLANMEKAMQAGFQFVQVGRALIRDPYLVRKLQDGSAVASDCDHCNRCMVKMAHGLHCVSLAEQASHN